ncbi:uncharacterized protein ISCGN_005932, partial [Ixodes scapularis]
MKQLLLNALPEQRLSAAGAKILQCVPPKLKLNGAVDKTRKCATPRQRLIAAAESSQ